MAVPAVAPISHPVVGLAVVNNSGIGGAERRFIQVWAAFKERGIPVSLAVNESLWNAVREAGLVPNGAEPDLMMTEPCGHIAFGLRKLDYAIALRPFARWIRDRRPALLHLVLGGAYLGLPTLWRSHGSLPTVISVVGPFRDMIGSPIAAPLYRWGLQAATAVEALTESIADSVRREGIAEEKIHVSPGSCVNAERFRPAPGKRPLVVFSGRLIAEKNPQLFIDACAIVRDRLIGSMPDLRFCVVGDGPLRNDVLARIQAHGLGPYVDVGWRPDVAGLLGEALIVVSLQQKDNYPSQALLEAMAAGAAVVATDVGSTSKLVDDRTGMRVKSDAQSVAAAIIAFLRDPALAIRLGQAGRERVQRDHSFERYTDYILDLYAELGVGQRARPAAKGVA